MKTLVVTNMQEMSQVLNTSLNNIATQTNLDNVDDDFGDLPIDMSNVTTPPLPQRAFNIRTLTQEMLDDMRKTNVYH